MSGSRWSGLFVSVIIASGAYGVFAYLRYPRLMSENMSGSSAAGLKKEMADLDVRIARLTQRLCAIEGVPDLPTEFFGGEPVEWHLCEEGLEANATGRLVLEPAP